VLGWQLAVVPIVLHIKTLGSLREGLLGAATERLAPAALLHDHLAVPMSILAAAVVVVVWTTGLLALGAWRTATRDA
jgi:hypothetical protein